MYVNETSCCGLRDISSLSEHGSPEAAVGAFKKQINRYESSVDNPTFSHAMFSAAWSEGCTKATIAKSYGEQFAAYIRDNKLGDVAESKVAVNPNSGNELRVYVWTINWKALSKWSPTKSIVKKIARKVTGR